MATLVRRIGEMERLPRGYAVAWWREDTAQAVCLPVGLHALVSWLRARWLAFVAWRDPSMIERTYFRGYRSGELLGLEKGRRYERGQAQRECDSLTRLSGALLRERYPDAASYLEEMWEAARRDAER